jgi:2-polyprenyl-3-methyl-5-hydroxy-6-metoxy-1,4-benzoquinol methylase
LLEDPRAVIRNVKKLLKPGGYIQWDEMRTSKAHILRAEEGVDTRAMETLMTESLRPFNEWVTKLAEILKEEGFEEAERFEYPVNPIFARAFFDMYLVTGEEMALTDYGGTEKGRRISQLVPQMYKEPCMGAVICTPI